jgi:hypothetical protein
MNKEIKIMKRWIVFFMIALFLSGLTALPVEKELAFLSRCFSPDTKFGAWIDKVYIGVKNTNDKYPFIAYGYDWLAFAHFVLAVLFIGPFRDPIRNKWVIEFGIIACLLVIPFAFIAGHYRGIPAGWRLIDCMFGVIGLIPLTICYRKVCSLERIKENLSKENDNHF